MPSKAAVFAALFATRRAAHELGDYWVQTDHQAVTKARSGRTGARACATHVATYTATNLAAVLTANRALHLGVGWRGLAAAELVSALSHYAADRREHGLLFPLADAQGKGDFLRHRGGAALLDQAWHHVFTTVAAALATLDTVPDR